MKDLLLRQQLNSNANLRHETIVHFIKGCYVAADTLDRLCKMSYLTGEYKATEDTRQYIETMIADEFQKCFGHKLFVEPAQGEIPDGLQNADS